MIRTVLIALAILPFVAQAAIGAGAQRIELATIVIVAVVVRRRR